MIGWQGDEGLKDNENKGERETQTGKENQIKKNNSNIIKEGHLMSGGNFFIAKLAGEGPKLTQDLYE